MRLLRKSHEHRPADQNGREEIGTFAPYYGFSKMQPLDSAFDY